MLCAPAPVHDPPDWAKLNTAVSLALDNSRGQRQFARLAMQNTAEHSDARNKPIGAFSTFLVTCVGLAIGFEVCSVISLIVKSTVITENGSAKVCHGSGGIVLLRAG